MINTKKNNVERICEYKGRVYTVHSNGTVMRHAIAGQKVCKADYVLTLGELEASTGYLHLEAEYVHNIVAKAFLGASPTVAHKYVVHRDGNKQNNKASNLYWSITPEATENKQQSYRKVVCRTQSIADILANLDNDE